MPSSAIHCESCPFASFPEADENVAPLEGICVIAHILTLSQIEEGFAFEHPIVDIPNERLVAARGCAMLISEGRCGRFTPVVARPLGSETYMVFFSEKGDTP